MAWVRALGLLAAAVMLLGAGYGQRYWKRYTVNAGWAAGFGAAVGVAAWLSAGWSRGQGAISWGFVALAAGSVWMAARAGSVSWAVLGAGLGLFARLLQLAVPVGGSHAQMLPVLWLEGSAVGVLAGLAGMDPVAGASVAGMAEWVAALAGAPWGRCAFALTVAATVAAWLTGVVLGLWPHSGTNKRQAG